MDGTQKVEQRDGSPTVKANTTTSKIGTVDTNPFFQSSSKKTTKLPKWLDHFNSRDLKTLFKCSAAAWIYLLLLLIEPTLKVIGQATFFGVMVIFIAPPSGVIFMGLMAGVTIILGACLGWTWGTITMKAALAARPAADLRRQYARLQQLNTQNTTYAQQASGQATFTQIAVYNGEMLDWRVSLTYFCMIGLFIYLVSRLRVAAPKLTLVSIFAMIISDIYLTVAPLIPTFQGTIARTLVLPAGISIGVATVCNIIFFPRSTSHLVLDGMQDVIKPMNSFLEACYINFQHPTEQMDIVRLRTLKGGVVRAFKGMEASFGFLALDASVGRWGTDDVKSLHGPLRRVLVMFISLVQIQIARVEHRLKDEELQQVIGFIDPEDRDRGLQKRKTEAGDHHLVKVYDFRQRSRHPDTEVLLHSSMRALATAGEDLLQTCQEALNAIGQSFRSSNSRRWFGRLTDQQCKEICANHTAVLNNLRQHKAAFVGRAAKDFWQAHSHMFDEKGKLITGHNGFAPPLGGLMLGLVVEERLYYFTEALEELLTKLIDLEQNRTRVRLWLPGNLQNFLPWALKSDVSPNDMSDKSELTLTNSQDSKDQRFREQNKFYKEEDQKKKGKKEKKKNKQNSEALDEDTAAAQLRKMKVRGVPRRSLQGRILIGTFHWFRSTEGLYALRMLVVTIGLGVPAVVHNSAGFYYREKGLWALIMAQTAMLPYTADFVASFFLRLLGTVGGAVVGLVMWYIGAGSGKGNPYGMAAIGAPIIIIMMWLRLFTSPVFMQGIILMVATTFLVMSYSWVDTHIPSYGNPGVGVSVFWRRMLLVMIGFAAAAFVTFFPRPQSASQHHRRLLAESLQTVKNQYALFAANCRNPKPDLKDVSEKTAVDASDVLLELEPQSQVLKFEFSSTNYTAQSVGAICKLCMNLNQTVTQLLIYATELPDDVKQRFLRLTGAVDESLVADIMVVLTILQQSLKSGDPLPAILPVPLTIRSIEGSRLRAAGEEYIVTMSEEKLATETTRRFCSAMSAFVQFLSNIDEMVVVVKHVVGETTWVDIEGSEMARMNRG